MKSEEQWKDGPGRMQYGDTVTVKAIPHRDNTVFVSFDVFGSHVECRVVYGESSEVSEMTYTDRNLSDEQKAYLMGLSKLFTLTSLTDLEPEDLESGDVM